MSEILVVIPWLPSASQGREIQYAVAGWRRHFKEQHRIVVVGEGVTGCVPDGCEAVESPRVAAVEGMYRQHLDYVSCLRKVWQRYPRTEGFVQVADDCYSVNDFDIHDVMVLKQVADTFEGRQDSPNGWQVDKWRTAQVLREAGLPRHNCTTHLPQYFEWKKLAELWARFDMGRVSYTAEDLYYNIYYKDRIFAQVGEADPWKFGLYEDNISAERIEKVMRRKVWLTNSPVGWSDALDGVLKRYYGL